MRVLALETSSSNACACLFDSITGEVVDGFSFTSNRRNSRIFSRLRTLLDQCERRIDRIAVGLGPGSYTGVRIGIASANGLFVSLGIPVVGVSSLVCFPGSGTHFVAGDARRKTYFLSEVRNRQQVGEPLLLDHEAFGSRLEAEKKRGSRIVATEPAIVEAFDLEESYPSAAELARIAAGPMEPNLLLEPLYLRPPYITKAKKKPVPGFPQ